MGRSLIQRNPTECNLPECYLETSTARRLWPTGFVEPRVYVVCKDVFILLFLVSFTVMFCCVEWLDDNNLIGIWKEAVVT